MRGFIRFCAGIFVVVGGLIVILSVVIGVLIFLSGASQTVPASGVPIAGGLAGILIIVGGCSIGASITLVGGATALLGSIDERLQRFERRSFPELYGRASPQS